MNVSFIILNQTMLTQVLHELRHGNLQSCQILGLSEHDIDQLQSLSPGTLARLEHASAPWVQINATAFRRILAQSEHDEQHDLLINRALRLGASSSIMYKCFGLVHSETAMRRRVLNILARKGRPQHLSEEQEHALWQRWRQIRTKASCTDPAEQLEEMMILAEEQQISLTLVWRQIEQHKGQK